VLPRCIWALLLLLAIACTKPKPPTPAPAPSAPLNVGTASWYGAQFAGRPTASGEPFSPSKLTAAHRTLPFGTIVLVTRLDTGAKVKVTINDRGPYAGGRMIDLSEAAAQALGMIDAGTARVRISVVGCDASYGKCTP
jgi:rare lipoprotein A